MKMYKKSDLTIVNGLFVALNGDIVMPDFRIVCQANELETLAQKAEYLAAQPAASPMPTLDGFERKSIKDSTVKFTTRTPFMDMKAAETMAIMDELDDCKVVEQANSLIDDFATLIEFAGDDFVIDCGGDMLACFDTPTLGSVLDLKREDIVSVIATVCGMEQDEIEVHRDCESCDDVDCEDNPRHDAEADKE